VHAAPAVSRATHDFAVRERLRSSFANSASTASHRAFRDVRNAPLVGRDGTEYAADLGQKQSGIFSAKGLDRIRRVKVICPTGCYVAPENGNLSLSASRTNVACSFIELPHRKKSRNPADGTSSCDNAGRARS